MQMSLGQQESYDNDKMTLAVNRRRGCRAVCDVVLKPDCVEECYREAIKKVNKQTTIPGYRSGRIPNDLLEKRFSREVAKAWIEGAANYAVQKAYETLDVEPLNEHSVYNIKCDSPKHGQEVKAHFEIEWRPEIPQVDISDIKITPLHIPEIDDFAVEHTMMTLRIESSETTPVTGRQVQEGDFVVMELALLRDGNSLSILKDKKWKVDSSYMPGWLYRNLLGMEVGEERIVDTELDNMVLIAVREGHTMPQCRITLQRIEAGDVHPLDDALAQKHGCNSQQEFPEKIRRYLEMSRQSQIQDDLITQIDSFLINKYQFDVPLSFYEAQLNEKTNSELKNLGYNRENCSEEMIQGLQAEAENEMVCWCRRFCIAVQLAKRYDFGVSDSEVSSTMLLRHPQYSRMNDREIQRAMIDIHRELLYQKAIDKLAQLVRAKSVQ